MASDIVIGAGQIKTGQIKDFYFKIVNVCKCWSGTCAECKCDNLVTVDEAWLQKYSAAQQKETSKVSSVNSFVKPECIGLQSDAQLRTSILICLARAQDCDSYGRVLRPATFNNLTTLVNSTLVDGLETDQSEFSDAINHFFNKLNMGPDAALTLEESALLNGSGALSIVSAVLIAYLTPVICDVAKIMVAASYETMKQPKSFAVADYRVMYGTKPQQSVARDILNCTSDSKVKGKERNPDLDCHLDKIIILCAALNDCEASVMNNAITYLKRPLGGGTLTSSEIRSSLDGVLNNLESLSNVINQLSLVLEGVDTPMNDTRDCSNTIDQGGIPDLLLCQYPRAIKAVKSSLIKRDDLIIEEETAARGDRFKGVQYSLSVKTFLTMIKDESNDTNDMYDWVKIRDDISQLFVSKSDGKKPKTPKGCIDITPTRMLVRELIMRKVKDTFQRYGAVQIDTPVFELLDTLMGKYGEESKLIYQLQDQGGESLALRYDLTVPFARYVATNAPDSIRRYHIGKVYRRDEPQMTKGRFREFYQCDIDIAGGAYDAMVPETEALCAWTKLLMSFEGVLGGFKVHLSHRILLNAMLTYCGVPTEKVRAISSAIDKLDKESWDNVRKEMVEVKHLDPVAADAIKQFVGVICPLSEVVEKLENLPIVQENVKDAQTALKELSLLAKYLKACNMDQYFLFDFSLARGLDYYTGLIYEARLTDMSAGSIGAGGRYDELIGMFSSKKMPSVGVSLGIERIFRLVEQKLDLLQIDARGAKKDSKIAKMAGCPTDIYVASDTDDICDRIRLSAELRDAGFVVEFFMKNKGKQFKTRDEKSIKFIAYLNAELIEGAQVEIREYSESGEFTRTIVNRDDICLEFKDRIGGSNQLQTALDLMGIKL